MLRDEEQRLDLFWNRLVAGDRDATPMGNQDEAVMRFHEMDDLPDISAEFSTRLKEQLFMSTTSAAVWPRSGSTPITQHDQRHWSSVQIGTRPTSNLGRLPRYAFLVATIVLIATMALAVVPRFGSPNRGTMGSLPAAFVPAGGTPEAANGSQFGADIPIAADSGLLGAYATIQINPLRVTVGSSPSTSVGYGNCCPQIAAYTVISGTVSATVDEATQVFRPEPSDQPAGTAIDLTVGETLVLANDGAISWANTGSTDAKLAATLVIGAYDGGSGASPAPQPEKYTNDPHQQVVLIPNEPMILQISLTPATNGMVVGTGPSISAVAMVADESTGKISRETSGDLVYTAATGPGNVITAAIVGDKQPAPVASPAD